MLTEKQQIIAAVIALLVCLAVTWGIVGYVVIFGSVFLNAWMCLFSAASAYWRAERTNAGTDIFCAQLFLVSAIVHGIINCM